MAEWARVVLAREDEAKLPHRSRAKEADLGSYRRVSRGQNETIRIREEAEEREREEGKRQGSRCEELNPFSPSSWVLEVVEERAWGCVWLW